MEARNTHKFNLSQVWGVIVSVCKKNRKKKEKNQDSIHKAH